MFLMLTMVVTLVALPAYGRVPPISVPTYAYISVTPDPVGVGQTAFVNFWLDKVPPTAYQEFGDRWENFTVKVTKPDGNTETWGPYESDDAGGAHVTYAPSATGNYTFVFNFPGQTIAGINPSPLIGSYNAIFIGDYFEPSTSATATLVVQEAPVTSLPQTPLPTSYWQRPINSLNIDWYQLGGNWLGDNLGLGGGAAGGGYYNNTANYNPYTTAPNTAHILWTKPYSFGGIVGGDYGGTTYGSDYNSNNMYQPKWGGIIINGVAFYTWVPGSTTSPAGWVAVDMRTGQTLWTKNTTSVLKTGQVLNIITPNQYGSFPYLWALPISPYAGPTNGGYQLNNTWEMYDAMTGNWILSIVNAPTSTMRISANLSYPIALIPTLVSDDHGNLIGYYTAGGNLTMWNSTLALYNYNYMTGRSVNSWVWSPPQGATDINWSLGIQWTVPLATTVTAPNGTSVPMIPGLGITKIASDVLFMTSTPEVASFSWNPGYMYEAGYSAIDGSLLWGPLWRTEEPWTKISVAAAAGNGLVYEFTQETMSWRAFNLKTGALVWGPTKLDSPTDVYGYYVQSFIVAFGGLYMCDLGGYVYALNATTGARLWTYFTGDAGVETPYGVYPLYNMPCAADGKIYVLGGHLYSPPLYRGALLYCLNATTGDVLWTSPNAVITNQPNCALADGYLLMPNAYDNQLYCYGKGQSATTVTASPKVSAYGGSVLIEGTVTDQSPGQTCLGIPAKGTPAISDASMDAWMQYLYQQQPLPTNATGVQVIIEVLDPNNNYYEVGRTTSDATGLYRVTFTPQVPGTYTIVTRFPGTESYYNSYAETAITVEQASVAPTSSPTPSPGSMAETYIMGFGIAIIIAIAVVGALILLALRKR
jgi:outer membrane protein assembly factor BamB